MLNITNVGAAKISWLHRTSFAGGNQLNEEKITLTPKADGEPQTIERRYLEIWRKEDGRWRVARTMDNTQ